MRRKESNLRELQPMKLVRQPLLHTATLYGRDIHAVQRHLLSTWDIGKKYTILNYFLAEGERLELSHAKRLTV